ncbi:MAG: hypothetical protein ACKO2C_08910 [Actinomycetes bacterium]
MKHRLRKAAIAGSLIAGFVAMSAPDAFAGSTLNQVGSDTTYWVQQVTANRYNIDTVSNPNGDLVVNVPPLTTAPFPTGMVTPADADCGEIIYKNDAASQTVAYTTNGGGTSSIGFKPPNGSGSGKTALLNDGSLSCVDLSRSSSGRAGSDPGTIDYYAYGLGALGWVKFVGSKATNLSQDSIIKIYTCDATTKAPIYDDWADVPEVAGTGFTGPIVKYIPQTGSGTFSFFKSKLLNNANPDANCSLAGADGQTGTADDNPATTMGTYLQEHSATGIDPATKARAIYVFDYAQWYAQSKQLQPDQRNGAVFGSINGVKPTTATINTGPTRFFGTRYVYTIVKSTATRYLNTMRYAGAGDIDGDASTPATNGYLCSGKAALTIKAFGFSPLKNLADANNGGLLSYCAKNPTAL